MIRVLIVDNKEENLYLLRALLGGHGYEVEEARNGAEALAKARMAPPHLIVSDLLMPVMDGYTLLRHWKADERLQAIPFIVYTATYTEPRDEQLALSLGADAFIIKPTEPEPFIARVMEVLAKEERGELPPGAAPSTEELVLLKQYTETLVRKLEKKVLQLEQTNRALEQDIAERQRAEERLSQGIREMALLNKVGHLVTSSMSLDDVGRAAIDGIAEALGADLILFFLRQNGSLQLQAIGPRDSWFKHEDTPAHRVGECLCGLSARDGEPVYCFDISNDPRCTWVECKKAGLRSFAAVPLKRENRVIAVLGLASGTPRDFEKQAPFLETLTAEIALGLQHSLLLQEITNRATELEQEVAARKQAEVALRESQEHLVLRLASTAQEIVDRKRAEEAWRLSEERFATLFRASPDAITLTSLSTGRIHEVNESGSRLTGYTREELIGHTTQELDIWANAADRERYVSLLQRDGRVTNFEADFRAKSGKLQATLVSGELVKFQDSQYILGVIRNITERKQAEEERQRLQAALRRSEMMAAIGALVAGVAHEARNPLFGISATLDAFEARFGQEPESAQYLTVLRGEANRLNNLMRDLLDYGRPPSPMLVPGSIATVITEAIAACAPLAREADVQVALTTAEGIAPLAMDAGHLPHVFQNLLQNAIQHSPRGGTVTVETAEVRDDSGVWIECTVKDSGPGFREEDLPRRIFEPFFSHRQGGTGLGLSIVERIVADHHGTVSAANRPEGGGAVTVRLPIADSGLRMAEKDE